MLMHAGIAVPKPAPPPSKAEYKALDRDGLTEIGERHRGMAGLRWREGNSAAVTAGERLSKYKAVGSSTTSSSRRLPPRGGGALSGAVAHQPEVSRAEKRAAAQQAAAAARGGAVRPAPAPCDSRCACLVVCPVWLSGLRQAALADLSNTRAALTCCLFAAQEGGTFWVPRIDAKKTSPHLPAIDRSAASSSAHDEGGEDRQQQRRVPAPPAQPAVAKATARSGFRLRQARGDRGAAAGGAKVEGTPRRAETSV